MSCSSQSKERGFAESAAMHQEKQLNTVRVQLRRGVAPADLWNAIDPAQHLTRDLVELVGWELRSPRLASAEVVRRANMQPLRDEIQADLLFAFM